MPKHDCLSFSVISCSGRVTYGGGLLIPDLPRLQKSADFHPILDFPNRQGFLGSTFPGRYPAQPNYIIGPPPKLFLLFPPWPASIITNKWTFSLVETRPIFA